MLPSKMIRVGMGIDVHAFCPGDHVWLGGIKVNHSHGLAGDSDADVLLHALADALLGALGKGDLGTHFPPHATKWKDLTSSTIIKICMGFANEVGASIHNVDLTLIGEEPKLMPHKTAIQNHIAALLGIDLGAVNIKATTTDGLGFTGRKEGLAAQAIVALSF